MEGRVGHAIAIEGSPACWHAKHHRAAVCLELANEMVAFGDRVGPVFPKANAPHHDHGPPAVSEICRVSGDPHSRPQLLPVGGDLVNPVRS